MLLLGKENSELLKEVPTNSIGLFVGLDDKVYLKDDQQRVRAFSVPIGSIYDVPDPTIGIYVPGIFLKEVVSSLSDFDISGNFTDEDLSIAIVFIHNSGKCEFNQEIEYWAIPDGANLDGLTEQEVLDIVEPIPGTTITASSGLFFIFVNNLDYNNHFIAKVKNAYSNSQEWSDYFSVINLIKVLADGSSGDSSGSSSGNTEVDQSYLAVQSISSDFKFQSKRQYSVNLSLTPLTSYLLSFEYWDGVNWQAYHQTYVMDVLNYTNIIDDPAVAPQDIRIVLYKTDLVTILSSFIYTFDFTPQYISFNVYENNGIDLVSSGYQVMIANRNFINDPTQYYIGLVMYDEEQQYYIYYYTDGMPTVGITVVGYPNPTNRNTLVAAAVTNNLDSTKAISAPTYANFSADMYVHDFISKFDDDNDQLYRMEMVLEGFNGDPYEFSFYGRDTATGTWIEISTGMAGSAPNGFSFLGDFPVANTYDKVFFRFKNPITNKYTYSKIERFDAEFQTPVSNSSITNNVDQLDGTTNLTFYITGHKTIPNPPYSYTTTVEVEYDSNGMGNWVSMGSLIYTGQNLIVNNPGVGDYDLRLKITMNVAMIDYTYYTPSQVITFIS